jgi:3-deoxy-D-manno-octulosonic-acid transferase
MTFFSTTLPCSWPSLPARLGGCGAWPPRTNTARGCWSAWGAFRGDSLSLRRLAAAGERPLIWLHAVSVGEVLAVTRLVRALESALPNHLIVVSTTTRTGQALARERFESNRVFYCPLDLPWAVRAWLNALRPSLLILAETEFWPNLLHGCFRRGIPVAVVNARISNRSWPRYQRLRRLWRPLLSRLSRVLAQSQTDADRLLALGCSPIASPSPAISSSTCVSLRNPKPRAG